MLLSPPSFAGRTQKSPTRSQESVWKRWRARVAYRRCSGLCGSWPMSFTWPSRCPLAFCEMASPRCVPIPQKAVAICLIDRPSTGRPRISTKPRPRNSSSRMRASSASSPGRGKSSRVMWAMSIPLRSIRPTARWISRISPSVRWRIQLPDPLISEPYQTSGPRSPGAPPPWDDAVGSVIWVTSCVKPNSGLHTSDGTGNKTVNPWASPPAALPAAPRARRSRRIRRR